MYRYRDSGFKRIARSRWTNQKHILVLQYRFQYGFFFHDDHYLLKKSNLILPLHHILQLLPEFETFFQIRSIRTKILTRTKHGMNDNNDDCIYIYIYFLPLKQGVKTWRRPGSSFLEVGPAPCPTHGRWDHRRKTILASLWKARVSPN